MNISLPLTPGDAEFISKLDEASKKKCKDELHELNDTDRASAVQCFRKWIQEQPWLRTPTGQILQRRIHQRRVSRV